MSYRRGYLSSTGGFADGFTSGFGLMNQALTDRRELEMAEESMAYEREQDALDREQAEKERQESIRQFNLGYELDKAGVDSDIAANQARIKESEAATRKSDAAIRASDAAIRESDAAIKESEAARLASEDQLKEQQAQRAIFTMDAMIRQARETGVMPNMDEFIKLIEQTEDGGRFNVSTILGEDFKENLATFTSTISQMIDQGNFDANDPRIVAGFDAIVNARQGRLIGQTVDKSFKNAPAEYQDGSWVVVSREARDISLDQGSDEYGPPSLELGANVLVTIAKKDDPDTIAQYIAPLTDSRDPKSDKQVKVQAGQFIDGVAGTAVLADYLQSSGMDDMIASAEIERMGGYGEYERRKQAIREDLYDRRDGENANPNSRDIMRNKPNSEVTDPEIERLAHSRALGRGRTQESYRDQANSTLLITSEAIKTEIGQGKYVFRVDGKNVPLRVEDLDDKTLFKIAATLKERGNQYYPTPETRRILEDFVKSQGGEVINPSRQNPPRNPRVPDVGGID